MLPLINLRKLLLLLFCSAVIISCKKQDLKPQQNNNNNKDNIIFYGLTDANQLIKYSTEKKLTELSSVSIAGLQTGEKILAIDFRPATGQLYGVGSTSRIYVINQVTGGARAINAEPFKPAIDGDIAGFDFNPTVDRIRLVTNNRQNLRLNPETGLVAVVDGMINPGAPSINAVAYTNNFAGAPAMLPSGAPGTTLYDIDIATDKLYIQMPPNDGTLVPVGPLGVDVSGEGGFDISPDGVALAALFGKGDDDDDNDNDKGIKGSNGNKYRLYNIDLQTGKAKNSGKFDKAIIGLAIPTNPVAYAVGAQSNNLLIFNPQNSDTTISKPITGLQAGELVLGIDFRPLNGQLYALGSTSRIYTINTATGAAAAVGMPLSTSLSGTSFGFDFNPTVDRIRIVSNTGQNLRVVPSTGALAFVDGNLKPGTPMVSAAAYLNNFAGATVTTLYDIDHASDRLLIQSPPNSGDLVDVGALGVNIDEANGFDIGGMSNQASALLTSGGITKLYSINLTTGTATAISTFQERVRGYALGLGF